MQLYKMKIYKYDDKYWLFQLIRGRGVQISNEIADCPLKLYDKYFLREIRLCKYANINLNIVNMMTNIGCSN